MKNILIPTDFSIRSLKLISSAVERFAGDKLNIILVHALEPDNSISGLLTLSRRMRVYDLYNEEFRQACEVLRNKYASLIAKITVELYYGTTKYYRNSFLDGFSIDAIIFPSDYKLTLPSKASNDMHAIFSKADRKLYYEAILSTKVKTIADEQSISELLHA